uniref:Uncharacterized protein n=1 Tax=Oryza brachyantha TaxID=4533 RepID=J3MGN5_ORYBR
MKMKGENCSLCAWLYGSCLRRGGLVLLGLLDWTICIWSRGTYVVSWSCAPYRCTVRALTEQDTRAEAKPLEQQQVIELDE